MTEWPSHVSCTVSSKSILSKHTYRKPSVHIAWDQAPVPDHFNKFCTDLELFWILGMCLYPWIHQCLWQLVLHTSSITGSVAVCCAQKKVLMLCTCSYNQEEMIVAASQLHVQLLFAMGKIHQPWHGSKNCITNWKLTPFPASTTTNSSTDVKKTFTHPMFCSCHMSAIKRVWDSYMYVQ